MKESSHAIMTSSLAKALIEAGIQHHDLGGIVSGIAGVASGGLTAIPQLLHGIGGALATTNPYSAQLAPTQTSDYQNTISGAQQNALAVNPQQNALAQQLLAQSRGQGPNPAQAALNQATGANVANQSALMAGARGAGGNVGLQSALAARQGANIEQQAIGQGATMQAGQQLSAEQQLQNLYGQQQQGANQLLDVASRGQNSQNTGSIQNYGMQQGIDSGVTQSNATAVNQLTGGLINGISGGAAAALKGGAAAAEGGEVEQSGDIVSPKGPAPILPLQSGGSVPGKAPHPGNDIRNDTELALLSKGEAVLPNSVMQSADPAKKASEFIKHLQESRGDKKESGGYEKVANAKKSLKDRIEHLEKLCGGGMAA